MRGVRWAREVMDRLVQSACIRLMGGLGNQLFQYGFGVRLANGGDDVHFDFENGFRRDSYQRTYALETLRVRAQAAPHSAMPIGMAWRPPFHRLAKLLWSLYPKPWRTVFYEKSPFGYDPEAIDSSGSHRYYFGYWQNPIYIEPVEDRLRKDLCLRHESEAFRSLRDEMKRTDSISVHVRRYHDLDRAGDVISKAAGIHGTCELVYYARALKFIPKTSKFRVFVFTDCLEWAKQHLQLGNDFRYVADLGAFSDTEEMILMASCQHHVISNSSFGWWGAWLGNNPRKVVVAPKVWNKSFLGDQAGVCPAGWIRL